jgi:hypothetical protein
MSRRVGKYMDRLHILSLRRGSRRSVVAAVASLMTLAATQTTATAAAGTEATRAEYLEGCLSGQACLWINASDDTSHDRRALVITPGTGPDLDQETPDGLGKVHGMGAEFTDNISVGWNNLPYDLCLMDTRDEQSDSKVGADISLRTSDFVLVVRSGKAFAQLENWNDKIDYYTTAQSGKCPRGGVTFRADTQEIIRLW